MYEIKQIGAKIQIIGAGSKLSFHEWYSAVKYIKERKINIQNVEAIPQYYRNYLFG